MISDSNAGFRRSSFCGSADCLEIAFQASDTVVVRDGKHPSTAHHRFTRKAWAAFLDAVRAGEFNR